MPLFAVRLILIDHGPVNTSSAAGETAAVPMTLYLAFRGGVV